MVSPQPDIISRELGATNAELGLESDIQFHVYIRDADMIRVDEIKEWIELSFINRFNRVGTWRLVVAANSYAASLITERSGIIIVREVEGVYKTIFSGFIGSEWEQTADTLSVAGWCDNKYLEQVTRPTPPLNTGPYPDEYDVTTGVASTIMRSLVSRNIGPAAPSYWQIPNIQLAADPLLGSVITARSRFDPLIVLLAELASTPIATGLGFKLIQSDTDVGKIEFQIYAPQDRHWDTKFSTELQTATNYKRVYNRPGANYFIVAGGDDFGINRTVVEGGDETSVAELGYRVAQFVDRRGVTDISELEQELAELIAGAVSSNTIDIVPSNTVGYQYGVDYDLGDYVTAVVEGVEYARLIQEVEITLSPENGVMIVPTIGDPYASGDDLLVQHLNTLSHRLSNIERNWNIPDNSLIPDMFHETIRPMVGDIKLTARNSSQPGWLVCDGSDISREVYNDLFLTIGTIYGIGNNSTTFNIPNFEGRGPIGVGGDYGLGETGGADTINLNFGTHHHNHSHGGGDLVFVHTHNERAHTHPGSHKHNLDDHFHSISHTHNTTIPAHQTGKRTGDTTLILGFDEPNVSSGTEDHTHTVLEQTVASGGAIGSSSGYSISAVSGSLDDTQTDSTAHAASYTGVLNPPNVGSTWSGGTDMDDTTATISATGINVKNPYTVVNFLIYTGVDA